MPGTGWQRYGWCVVLEHSVAGEGRSDGRAGRQISTAEVNAVRECWIDHRDEIDAQLEARDDLHDELVEGSRAPSA